ncbi:MAG TPA: outer membrane beta-barrel family protein, partial [Chitinophagaceae bacterium]|nr:outer membrane beta-barrel family protein [Chitinophagaceae bacterium]
AKDSIVGAMFTRPNGDFRFTNLSPADSFKLVITAIGYAATEQRIPFSSSGNNGFFEKDLGNILLEQDVKTLAAVTVTAQKPALQMGIDRRIFDVSKSLTATGGTAVDVMKNIPSVTVNVAGEVTLRNSTPQIFVDGRPTILTLEQIPADNIERVELITNPSAKFDAASTGGIINVVLKRNKRVGLNGVISVGAGYPNILNSNVSLNARQGAFNFFVSGSYNQSGGKANGSTERQNLNKGIIENYFNQYSINNRQRRFASIRFGLDYFLDNRNTISVTQGLVKGKFDNKEEQDQEYLNSNKILERFGDRTSENKSDFNRYTTELNFSHKFPDVGKELTAGITYNYGNGATNTNILNRFYFPDGREFSAPARVRNEGSNNNDQVTVQVDFVNPLSENAKLETGIRSFINNYGNKFSTYSINNGSETKLPLSNNIEYREMVNAFYITYSNKLKWISYQAGLRAEHSDFSGSLLDSGKDFGYRYPKSIDQLFDALFPSLFLTKELSESAEMGANYSRRIRRPNFWQLNPFVDINDPVNLSQGNPELRPQFTNSFELNYSQEYKSGSFMASAYFNNTQGNITRYSDTISAAQYAQLNNAAIDPNAILNTFINGRYSNRLGGELTLQHKIGERFEITPTVNAEYQKVKADVNGLNLSNKGINWEAKLITNYRIVTEKPSFFNNFSIQAIGEYESPRIMPQGKALPEYSVDFALRKEFLKDKRGSLTLSANDIFWTDREGTIYDTENFYQESYRRNVRNFRINFSYRFGDNDFKLFNRNSNNGGGED